jgi:BMFP domain-containing protein YqiC
LVKSIRAEDLTAVSVWAQREVSGLADCVRVERVRVDVARQELARSRAESARLRAQVDQLIGKLAAGERVEKLRCGHPNVKYNVYRHVDRSGAQPRLRELCRECNRERVSRFRAKKRQPDEQSSNASALQNLHSESVGSAP